LLHVDETGGGEPLREFRIAQQAQDGSAIASASPASTSNALTPSRTM
jgi:hypothetical protein